LAGSSHVALRGERLEHLEPARRQPREAEHRQPLGQVDELGLLAQARAGGLDPLRRVGLAGAGAQAAPQLRLPAGVLRQLRAGGVDVLAGRPRADHRRALERVAVEQLGDVAHAREPARLPRRVGGVERRAQVGGEALQPRLVQGGVDDLQQRPHEPLRQPRVRLRLDPGRDRDRLVGQPPRRREGDVRADAVGVAGGDAEPGREPLRQPALHAARGHGDQLRRERIGRRLGQQRREGAYEPVGPLGSVDVQHRHGHIRPALRRFAPNGNGAGYGGIPSTGR
jgi:hypothetical protein